MTAKSSLRRVVMLPARQLSASIQHHARRQKAMLISPTEVGAFETHAYTVARTASLRPTNQSAPRLNRPALSKPKPDTNKLKRKPDPTSRVGFSDGNGWSI